MVWTSALLAQKKITVGIHYLNDKPTSAANVTKYERLDSIAITKYLSDIVIDKQSKGFILTNIDTLLWMKDTCIADIYLGQQYTIGGIDFTPEQKSIIEASGIRRTALLGKAIDSTKLGSFIQSLVNHQTSNGYPFATVRFDSVHFQDQKLFSKLHVNKGKYITFDSIQMEGLLEVNTSFLQRFLNIKPSDDYDHSKIIRASKRLNDLPYAKQKSEPFVRFINDKAALVLQLDPKPASRFDFLIGILPTQNTDGSRKINLAVDFTSELNNSFGQGEYIFAQVKRLKPEFLELQLKSTLPYIAGLPIGAHMDFRIFKNGLQNIDLFFDGGFQYLFGGFNNVKLLGSFRSSNLLEVNADNVAATGKLPSRLDVSYSGVGLGLSIRNLDYRFNPTKGWNIEINTIVGNKKIKPNRVIVQLTGFENSYDTLKLNTFQADIDAVFASYFPLKDWATIKFGGSLGLRYNQQQIRDNELLRIGGNKLLRGFDEESIFTGFYAFSTAEFRFIFDQNSYLSLPFIDAGYTQVMVDGVMKLDPVIGVGMGLNFGTSAGIFNLSFAAGRNLGNPFDFSKMKVHFGYVNLF
jgi:outer membrane protein assembly factor BamA